MVLLEKAQRAAAAMVRAAAWAMGAVVRVAAGKEAECLVEVVRVTAVMQGAAGSAAVAMGEED
eukprot:scaffold133016_cov18-Tisochrysis_lutea.AAC.2